MRDALAQGAAGALVDADWAARNANLDLPLVAVADTRLALGQLAAQLARTLSPAADRHHRQQRQDHGQGNVRGDPARAISASDAVLATDGNLNNDIGLPLTLLQVAQRCIMPP